MSGPENELSSTLQRQAEQFARRGGHDLDLDQVVSRAGEIRRGRRMRATMVMAAVVLAIAVPVGVTVIGDDPTKQVQPAPQPTPQPDLSPLTIKGLETGDKPATGYAEAGRLQPGDISNSLPDGQEPAELARVGEDFLVGFQDETGELVARYLTVDGVVGEDLPASYGFGVTPGGETAAIVQPDGTVIAYQDHGTKQVQVGKIPAAGSYTLSAVLGSDCSPGGDCTVFVSTTDEDPKLWAIAVGSDPRVVFKGLRGAVGVTYEFTAGYVSVSDDGSCSEVRDGGDGVLWKTCDNRFVAFSPGAKYLIGTGPYGSGLGDAQLTILDAPSGKVILDLTTAEGATITTMTWEDDDHVLATIIEDNTWAVVRIGLDGEREYALGPISTGDDLRSPFFIADQR